MPVRDQSRAEAASTQLRRDHRKQRYQVERDLLAPPPSDKPDKSRYCYVADAIED